MRLASAPRPRAHVHRGSVEAVALWFDPALLGEAEARRRVLAAWTPGVGVFSLAGGFLLRLPAPRRMDCGSAPGLPFTLVEGVLCSVPLSASERERLAPTVGSAVLVRAGKAQVHPLGPPQWVDVSAWLDVSGWKVVAVEGLGAPPPPVAELTPVEAPTRASFGLGAAAPEAEAMRARMEGRPVPEGLEVPREPGLWERLRAWWRGETRRPGQATVDAGGAPAPSSWFGRLVSSFLEALAGLSRGSGPATSGGAASGAQRPPSGPGLFSQLTEWLLSSTPLGELLGRRKAEYVRKLFELLDGGNLDEALRYAVPLAKEGGLSEQARVSLGLPGPRESLSITSSQGSAGGSLFGSSTSVYEALRERYRAAFKKLEREGRIEEAAFVLAELLQESEEAVSFLERHGRLELAAEVAEGRQLAPGLVVRQWVLAGDVARAVDLARRTGAFADAVLRLERTHPAEARALRLRWGEVLAEAGDYARAVEVVWPLEDARPLIRTWLERGVESGGVGGARLLARMLAAFPDSFEWVRARALVLLEGEDAEGAPVRQALTEALARAVEGSEPGRVLLRAAVRATLRDRAAGLVSPNPRGIEELVALTKDAVLRTDLPVLPPQPERAGFASGGTPRVEVFGAGEGGPWPLYDVVPLSGGRLLVALGEAGARLITRDGRCVAHFDVPAFSLVLSRHEDRALALAPRGTLKRVSRLDLVRRRAEPWCDLRADAFAPEYDGSLWFLAVEDTVMAVDALAPEPRALWRVSQVGGHVFAVAAGPSELSFVMLKGDLELERWTYALPDSRLRSRQPLPGGPVEQVRHVSLRMDGELAVLAPEGVRWFGPARQELLPQLPETALAGLVLGGAWFAVLRRPPEGGAWIRLHERKSGTLLAQFMFEGEHPVGVRFLNGELLLFDAVGRLARVDPGRGEVRRVVPR
ncbi:bpX6 domain-containing protein [Archangium sp.]|uniref:bpX6 domain-containing protein n=1 Tax=Archangium sp. TaxID=1872627 RepID=UPI003899FC49